MPKVVGLLIRKNLLLHIATADNQTVNPGVPLPLILSTLLQTTGRQLPPLSSVLYRIISERLTVLAAQLLLREKSGG
jgi:hypothetical protein